MNTKKKIRTQKIPYSKKIRVHEEKLIGYLEDGTPANNRQAKDVAYLGTRDGRYQFACPSCVNHLKGLDPRVIDYAASLADEHSLIGKGPGINCILSKSSQFNFYEGYVGDQEINVDLKKRVGTMRFIGYLPRTEDEIEKLNARMKQEQ